MSEFSCSQVSPGWLGLRPPWFASATRSQFYFYVDLIVPDEKNELLMVGCVRFYVLSIKYEMQMQIANPAGQTNNNQV